MRCLNTGRLSQIGKVNFNMAKKNVILVVIVLVIIIAVIGVGIAKVVADLLNDGYAYYGDGWQDTPEKALAVAADGTIDDEMRLTVKNLLDIQYIDDIVTMTFVSKGDTLVTATLVTNEKGQYHFHASSQEENLDSPVTFVLNGDVEQWILSSYFQYNTKVYGWKYSTAPSVLVNGNKTNTKTYTFNCQGKEWSIDYWWVDLPEQYDEIEITYES